MRKSAVIFLTQHFRDAVKLCVEGAFIVSGKARCVSSRTAPMTGTVI